MFKYEPNYLERRDAEATLANNIRSVFNHYKKEEAMGHPFVKDPLSIGNFQKKFSGMKLIFEESKVYGLSRVQLQNLKPDLAELKVTKKCNKFLNRIMKKMECFIIISRSSQNCRCKNWL